MRFHWGWENVSPTPSKDFFVLSLRKEQTWECGFSGAGLIVLSVNLAGQLLLTESTWPPISTITGDRINKDGDKSESSGTKGKGVRWLSFENTVNQAGVWETNTCTKLNPRTESNQLATPFEQSVHWGAIPYLLTFPPFHDSLVITFPAFMNTYNAGTFSPNF